MNATNSSLADLRAQAQCFALPYGGIGFVIDILISWAVCFILIDESPSKCNDIKHPLMNAYFASIGLVGGISVSIYNAVLCKEHGLLLLLSIWKGVYVGCVNFFSLASNWDISKEKYDSNSASYTIALSSMLSIIAFVGIGVVAQEGWEDDRMKIVVSVSTAVLILSIISIRVFMGRDDPGDLATEIAEWLVSIMMALCLLTDMIVTWILAISANNIGGVPVGRGPAFISTYIVYVITILIPFTNA